MAQEIYSSHPALLEACEESIFGHAQTLVPDIAGAIAQHSVELAWTPLSLAIHIQAVIQGAFIMSKASGNPELACESIDHLRLYLQTIFGD